MDNYLRATWLALCIAFASPAGAQSFTYALAEKPWDAELGTHRVVLRVSEPAAAARAHLEWRRRDRFPEKKGVIVVDAHTQQRVMNALAINVGAEAGGLGLR
jgi:hypothetical protein